MILSDGGPEPDLTMLWIDGSQGEGGGQVLRTSLSLAAITGRPFTLFNLRAGRSKPGLQPQHLTAVRAVAAVCGASLKGDKIHSTTLEFRPGHPPRGGQYLFDVTQAAGGGSAGATSLIFQALLWPLLFADSPSQLILRGGTHVPFSPPFHYLAEVAHPLFLALGANFEISLNHWGWYPAGGGEITATIQPIAGLQGLEIKRINPQIVQGLAVVTNLPADIPQRMANRAVNLLKEAGLATSIRPAREKGVGMGAGIFLWLPQAGFSALGRKGLPSDKVAEMAVEPLLAFVRDSSAGVDQFLADQLLLPMALAHGPSLFRTGRITQHTLTNAKLLHQWLACPIIIDGELDRPGQIILPTGINWHFGQR